MSAAGLFPTGVRDERTPEPGQPRTGAQGARHDRDPRRRLPRRRRRRADRCRRPQRRRQEHPPVAADRRRRARLRPGHPPRRPRHGRAGPVRHAATRDDGARRRPAGLDVRRRARVGRRPRRPLGADRSGARPAGPRRAGGPDVRRRAAPGGAGGPADPAAGPARPRRAHQPPGRRGRRLAGRVRAGPRRRSGGRHPRPVVPRRGLHDHVGGRRRKRARLRRRVLGVHAGPGGAGPDLVGHRGAPAQPGPQGAGLAAPRPAGPHEQAEVPDRGGPGADRRRAPGPRLDGAQGLRRPAARQDRLRRRGRRLRRPHRRRPAHPVQGPGLERRPG